MLSATEAETIILNLTQPLDPQRDREVVPLRAALSRILAAPVTGQLDIPHWHNSAMDGYAVRYADVQDCHPDQPVTLEIIEAIPAGAVPTLPVQAGQAARILTGSMLPTGADTIVMQEETRHQGDRVTILSAPKPQAFVRHRGAFYQAGAPLLPAGILLSAADMAILATVQCLEVPVYRRVRVAILSTGDELVSPEQPLQPGQIVDSNQYALAALVAQAGAEPLPLGIVRDDPEATREAITQALSMADVVLSSGGVSVGDYDYIDRILAELGAEIAIRAVAVKPGKPLTVATFPPPQFPTLYFGLPGNPVSAFVTFWRFVQPALRKLSGLSDHWLPTWSQGRTLQDLRSDGKRETYLWGRATWSQGELTFDLASGSASSGNLINLSQTNALAVLPIGQTYCPAGTPVSILGLGC
ncbi:MAG: molybdopterin molybdotransferase MoeA [Elainella sp. Prado103]|jgi:molybdopterin molybdotransferase|nr:molybdopterin molybdotransferase MoeA [Elainella sp. Prado103]